MNNAYIQLIVLAAIAIFLILRLRNVLGTRDGFEPTQQPQPPMQRQDANVIDGTATALDNDITDHVEAGSPMADALNRMKQIEPSFHVGPFLSGAKSAYEMILLAFERGDLSDVRAYLASPVADALQGVIDTRKAQNQTTEAQYLGTRETSLENATFDPNTQLAEITVRFVGEQIFAVRDADGTVVDGDPKAARKQRDTWTFARQMGHNDPNWQLVATA